MSFSDNGMMTSYHQAAYPAVSSGIKEGGLSALGILWQGGVAIFKGSFKEGLHNLSYGVVIGSRSAFQIACVISFGAVAWHLWKRPKGSNTVKNLEGRVEQVMKNPDTELSKDSKDAEIKKIEKVLKNLAGIDPTTSDVYKHMADELELTKKHLEDMQNQKSLLEEQLKRFEETKKELKKLVGERETLKQTQEEALRNVQELTENVKDLRGKLHLAGEEESSAKKALEEKERNLKDLTQKIQGFETEQTELNAKIKKLEKDNEQLKSTGLESSTDLLTKGQEILNLKQDLQEIESQKKDADTEISKLKTDISELQQSIKDQAQLEQKHSKMKAEINKLTGQKNELETKFQSLETRIQEKDSELQEKLRAIEEKTQEGELLKSKNEELILSLKQLRVKNTEQEEQLEKLGLFKDDLESMVRKITAPTGSLPTMKTEFGKTVSSFVLGALKKKSDERIEKLGNPVQKSQDARASRNMRLRKIDSSPEQKTKAVLAQGAEKDKT